MCFSPLDFILDPVTVTVVCRSQGHICHEVLHHLITPSSPCKHNNFFLNNLLSATMLEAFGTDVIWVCLHDVA